MFTFRLASIKRLKEYKESQCQSELAECIQEFHCAKQRGEEIENEITFLGVKVEECQEGVVELAKVKLYIEYLQYKKEQLNLQKNIIIEKHNNLVNAQTKLTEAMKERKILDKLHDKQYESYLFDQNKSEQIFLDDLAAGSYEVSRN